MFLCMSGSPDFSLWTSGFFSGTSRFLNIQIVFSTSRFFFEHLDFRGNLRILFSETSRFFLTFCLYLFFPPDFSLYVRIFWKPPDVFEHPDLLENLRIFYVNVRIFWGTSGFSNLRMFWCMSGLLIYLRRNVRRFPTNRNSR